MALKSEIIYGNLTSGEHAFITDLFALPYEQGDVLYYDGSKLNRLAAGTNGHFLKTLGAGANPTWAAPTATAAPGGADTQVQFNDGGLLAGSSLFTFNKANGVVTAGGLILGINSITMSGTIATTGARVTKGWFDDIESTNMPTVGGTSIAATFAPKTAPTFATSITGSYLTASQLLATDGSKNIVSLDTATYPSLTELSYVKGVTSGIQAQINAKGTGNVTKVGTPVDNQIGIWTGDGTIEGLSTLTYDPASFILTGGESDGLFEIHAVDATVGAENGGSLFIYAGTSVGGAGGDVILRPGTGVTNGDIIFTNLATGFDAIIDIHSIATSSKTFTLPNTSGTFALVTGTSNSITVGTIELGAASDTTLARVSAGVVSIEGVNILTTATGLPLTGGTMTGNITLGETASIALDPAGSADGKYTGITVTGIAGYTQAFGDLVYLDPTDSRWEACDANSAAGADGDSRGIIGMVVSAGTDGNACTILLHGIIRADAKFPTFTVNNPIYVSETAGAVTQTQPTTTDVVIRIVGSALTADEMFFNPDWAYITHT